MKKNGKLIAGAAAILVLAAVFAGIWFATRPATSEGAKTITVEVVHKDESSKTFTYHTDVEYLGEVLQSEGLVKGAFYQDGEYASQSIDQTPISDGDSFSLVYTVG